MHSKNNKNNLDKPDKSEKSDKLDKQTKAKISELIIRIRIPEVAKKAPYYNKQIMRGYFFD